VNNIVKELKMGLEQYQVDVEMCCRCSSCKFVPFQKMKGIQYSNVCPSITKYNFHGYSGGGRLNLANAMLNKTIEYNDKLRHIVFNCQMCGACGVSCNYAMDMEVMQPINEMRIKCVADGQTHPALDKVIGSLRQTNSMVSTGNKRGEWAVGLNLKNATKEKVDVLFYAGCLTSFDKNKQKLAISAARILQQAGVNFGIAGDAEICCGGRAYQMGYQQDFLNQAKKNIELINKTGARTLVTGCAECYHAFKVLYEKFKLKGDLEVLHISEYIDNLLKEGRLKLSKKVNLTVTYHDPCNLGRLGEPWIHWEGKKIPGDRFVFDPPKEYRRGTKGIYEPPREVIKSVPGVKLSEMTRIKEYAWCCGAGGGVRESNPEFALWTARERIEEAKASGAEAIVTACPWCEWILSEAIQVSGSSLKVYDLVELVEKAL
jgi:Fe-S oxidoreductase